MDSSRSGLLSTLLMTLPLIIVPAIALLRPAGGPSGVSQTIVRGSESPGDASGDELDIEMLEGFDKSVSDAPEFHPDETTDVKRPPDDSGIDDLLPDSSPTPGAPKKLTSTLPESSEAIGRDPFQQLGSNESPTDTPQNQPAGADVDTATEASIRQLQALGAIRTLWFVPGTTTSHGFAAFFRGETELVRYRFEATGPTRSGCVEDVLQQVRQWRNQSARNTQPLD